MNNSQPSKFINLSLAFLWGYQGLIPKILFINPDEITIWQTFGLSYAQAQLAGQGSGILECVFALLFLFTFVIACFTTKKRRPLVHKVKDPYEFKIRLHRHYRQF